MLLKIAFTVFIVSVTMMMISKPLCHPSLFKKNGWDYVFQVACGGFLLSLVTAPVAIIAAMWF